MSNLEVCRVCLAGNVRIHNIKNNRIKDVFEALTFTKLSSEDGRPETVCYICYRQLQRCLIFSEKSKNSRDILSEMICNGIEISQDTITSLTQGIRASFGVTSEYHSYNSKNVKHENMSDDEELLEVNTCSEHLEIKSEVQLCRGCLSADLRTSDIRNTLMKDVFEKLTNNQIVEDGWPVTLCYICISQLRVASKIAEKAKKTEYVLSELIYNGVQLTQNIISILNRRIKATYTCSSTQFLSYNPNEEVNIKDEVLEANNCEIIHETGYRQIKTETNLGQQIKIEVEISGQPQEFTNTNKKTATSNGIVEYGACDICNFKSNSEKKLKRHIKIHDPNRKYPCNVCHKRYLSKSHLDLHKHTIHKKIFECRTCKELFWNKIKYNNHVLTHTAKDLYPCENCEKVFQQPKNLRAHYASVHKEIRHPCDRCNYTSLSYQYLQDHIIRKHAKTDRCICDICHKTFSNKSSLKKHLLNSHYSTEEYDCDFCFKVFKSKQNLKVHYKSHMGEKPFKCDKCDKAYREKRYLINHSLIHGKREFSCNICQKDFFKKEILKTHMKTHNNDKLFECELCEKKFINTVYLGKHMQTHSIRRYECIFCDKEYKSKISLKYHIKSMHGKIEKTFLCDICDKAFITKQYLISHLNYHAGKKSFPCDVCKKCFVSKHSMMSHKMTHTGEKPYECNDCGKCFVQRAALRRHIRAHNKDKPHKCKTCGKSFAEKLSLRTHNFTSHDNIERFICNHCYKVFLDKDKLINHVKHHKRKPFSCKTCKKTYLKLSTLTQHMRVHPAQFFCAFCDRQFTTKSNLHRHNVREHKAISRYACNVCEKPIESLLGLNAHIRKHTGEKQFQCELCEKTFVERRDLLHHMKIIHNVLQWFN